MSTKTLQITDTNARQWFKDATGGFKAALLDTYGEAFFKQSITDRIKTFEDACAETGENPLDAKFTTGTTDEIAYKKLKVIIKALNEGWVPDWTNGSQRKWFPYFQYSPSGFRFLGTRCDYDIAHTDTGSRLSLANEQLARYAGTQFNDLYNQLLN